MQSFEIFFDDLNEEAQQRLCETMDINTDKEMNWDIVPLAIIDFEEEEKLNHNM